MSVNKFTETINGTFDRLGKQRENYTLTFLPREVGAVVSISAGIVKVPTRYIWNRLQYR